MHQMLVQSVQMLFLATLPGRILLALHHLLCLKLRNTRILHATAQDAQVIQIPCLLPAYTHDSGTPPEQDSVKPSASAQLSWPNIKYPLPPSAPIESG